MPNWHLRLEILKLICLLIYDAGTGFEIDDLKLLTTICALLDDDVKKVKMAAFDTLVVICKHWPKLKAQEILVEIMEVKVFEFLCDKIDDRKYDVISQIKQLNKVENEKIE